MNKNKNKNKKKNNFMNFEKFALILISAILIISCDINGDMRSKSGNKESADARTIAANNGCMGCHAVSNKVVGPAWKRVAQHYKNTPNAKELLIAKIKSGGKGNWDHETGGESMPGFEGKISEKKLVKVVDYILSLEKAQ